MSYSFHSFDIPRQLPLSIKISLIMGNVFFVIGIIFFLVGTLSLVVFSLMLDFNSFGFGDNLQKTSGEILFVESTGSRENKVLIYKFGYRYVVDEKSFNGVSFQTGQGMLKPGDIATIEYEKAQPGLSRIEGMRMNEFPFWVIWFLFIFPTIGLIFLLVAILGGIKNIRLITYGILTKGKVTGKEPTNTRINNKRVYKVFFEFKTQEGAMIKTSVNTHHTHLLEDEPEEMLVYDGSNPEKAVLLDALGKSVRKFFS